MFQTGLKKSLWLKKVKNAVPWTFVMINFNGQKIVEGFCKKQLQ